MWFITITVLLLVNKSLQLAGVVYCCRSNLLVNKSFHWSGVVYCCRSDLLVNKSLHWIDVVYCYTQPYCTRSSFGHAEKNRVNHYWTNNAGLRRCPGKV